MRVTIKSYGIEGIETIETDNMSISELQEIVDNLEVWLIDINTSIAEAGRKLKKTGEYSDSGWYQRIRYQRDKTDLSKKLINRAIMDKKTEQKEVARKLKERQNASFEREFMRMARQILSPNVYQEIILATDERVGHHEDEQK